MLNGTPREMTEMVGRLHKIYDQKLRGKLAGVEPMKIDVEQSINIITDQLLSIANDQTANSYSASSFMRDVLVVEVHAGIVAFNHSDPAVRRQFYHIAKQVTGLSLSTQSLIELNRSKKNDPENVFDKSLDNLLDTVLSLDKIDDGLDMREPDTRAAVYGVLARLSTAVVTSRAAVRDPGQVTKDKQWRPINEAASILRVSEKTLRDRAYDSQRGSTGEAKSGVTSDGIQWRRSDSRVRNGNQSYEFLI